jgi:A/G-specific adenine glycosylase
VTPAREIPVTSNNFMPPLETGKLSQKLLHWFAEEQRDLPWRKTSNPYFIWVSEVMLQQTQVQTVIPYYLRFIDRFPTVDSLAVADLNDVLKIWEGLGYYARARNLQKAAKIVSTELNSQVPEDYSGFRTLPGVGDYIAAAVQSIAFGRPIATVDGNVKRVLSRLFRINQPVNLTTAKNHFVEVAAEILDVKKPGDFNQAMMELGALICKPSIPVCDQCPVSTFCQAFEYKKTADFPKRNKRKQVPTYQIAVGVVLKNDRMLITLRKPEGLLGGLWEFPGGKTEEGESSEQACLREIKEETNLDIRVERSLAMIKHAYTHFKIVMEVFICQHVSGRVRLDGPVDHRWISFEQIKKYPFPKANHKVFSLLGSHLASERKIPVSE